MAGSARAKCSRSTASGSSLLKRFFQTPCRTPASKASSARGSKTASSAAFRSARTPTPSTASLDVAFEWKHLGGQLYRGDVRPREGPRGARHRVAAPARGEGLLREGPEDAGDVEAAAQGPELRESEHQGEEVLGQRHGATRLLRRLRPEREGPQGQRHPVPDGEHAHLAFAVREVLQGIQRSERLLPRGAAHGHRRVDGGPGPGQLGAVREADAAADPHEEAEGLLPLHDARDLAAPPSEGG